jgi:hypothetical protein
MLDNYHVSARCISGFCPFYKFHARSGSQKASCICYRIQRGACLQVPVLRRLQQSDHFTSTVASFILPGYPTIRPLFKSLCLWQAIPLLHEILHWPLLTGPLLTGPLQLCNLLPAPASAIEDWVQITPRQRRRIGVIPKPLVSATSTAADQPTNREAYYRCLSALQRKTSELEGEEENTSTRT